MNGIEESPPVDVGVVEVPVFGSPFLVDGVHQLAPPLVAQLIDRVIAIAIWRQVAFERPFETDF